VQLKIKRTYSKLANLGVVNTHDLIFLGGTKAEAGDEVHDEQDDACTEKGIGKSGDGVGKLVTKLDIVVVDPAAINLSNTVKVRYVIAVKGKSVQTHMYF
jgi:hypothetical protein